MKTDLSIPALLVSLDERAAEYKAEFEAGRLSEDDYIDALDFLSDQRTRLLMVAA